MQIGKADAPVSHISQAYPDRVEVRGRDLTGDLMGRLSFTEYFYLLLTGREPTAEQRYFLDLLLVSIAERDTEKHRMILEFLHRQAVEGA